MNIKVFQNRKVSKDYFDNEGTQNENYSTTLSFEVPLGYEDFSKRIVFITEDGNFWDYIKDNEYVIKNNITKYENVEAYLWLTKDNQDFRSETFELNFYENQNPDDMTPSEEQLDGYNTLIAELELKVEEVDTLKEETLEALEKLKEQQIDYENRFKEINDMLKELKDTNEYQSEIIDQFKNEFDEKEFEGASAHLPDSAELPILDLGINGGIEQDSSEASINICPDKFEYWESGDYSAQNGEKTDTTSRIRLKELLKVTPSEEYYFNHHFVSTETVLFNFVLRGYDINKNFVISMGAASNNSSKIMPSNVEYIGLGLYNAKNTDTEVFETYQELFESGAVKPFICLNSETDKSYVAYSVNMPSIAFPSEVKGVSGHYDTVVENKQLFKKYTDTGSLTVNGVEITNNADGSFTLNGTCTQNSWVEVVTAFQNGTVEQKTPKYLLNGEETYTFSLNKISGSVSNSTISAFLQANTSGSFGVSETKNQIQVKGNGVYRSWIYLAKDVVFNNYVFALQLEVGDTKTEYTPHQSQNLPIDIPFNMYSGKPYKENGKWYRQIEWYKEKITSSNVLQKNSFGTNCYALSRKYATRVKGNEKIVFSNYFKGISYNDRTNGIKDSIYNEASYIVIRDTTFTTVEELKTFLDNNNVYIVYQIATPTLEEITDTTLIEQLENIQRAFSYYPVTNVNSYKPTVNVANLILNGKYYVSNKVKFKTLEKRVQALENEIVNE